jgi:hypothetical protein
MFEADVIPLPISLIDFFDYYYQINSLDTIILIRDNVVKPVKSVNRIQWVRRENEMIQDFKKPKE